MPGRWSTSQVEDGRCLADPRFRLVAPGRFHDVSRPSAGRAHRRSPATTRSQARGPSPNQPPGTFTPKGAAASAMDAAAPVNVVYGWGPTFLGAPHDNLSAEQGLVAEGEGTNGQG